MRTKHSLIVAAVLAVVPAIAVAEHKVEVDQQVVDGANAETIVKRHIAALGGAKLLRAGKSVTFTVSGEKMGKKFTKTVVQARPNLMRVDVQSEESFSKGFDGRVAWMKKGTAPAQALTAEETTSMKSNAEFEEPLLDYAKKGTKVTLVGKVEVNQVPAYDLLVAFKNGETEHHFIDATSYLLLKRTMTMKEKDGKAKEMSVRFGDYKKVQGRMVNHSVEWDGDDGKTYKSVVSNVAYDKPVNAKLFAMPKQ